MGTDHDTILTETELARMLAVHVVVVVSWIEFGLLKARADELGFTIKAVDVARFEDQQDQILDSAVCLCARVDMIAKARETWSRAQNAREK